jgi:hypothetical protein
METRSKKRIPSLARKAEMALRKAVHEVIVDHKRTGDPVVIWRDGRVVRVPAAQLLRRRRRAA